MQGGPAPSGMASAQTAIQNAAQRPQSRADLLGGLSQFTSLDTPQDMSLGATAADIALGFAPGIGTAQGIRDFERARRDDDMLGMALGGLSAIPLAGGIIKAGRGAGRTVEGALDMSQAARMQRADEMGFDVAYPVFHGSPEVFNAFDYEKIGTRGMAQGPGFYFSTDPDVAKGYGNINEYLVRVSKPLKQTDKPFSVQQTKEILKNLAQAQADEYGMDLRDTFLSDFADTYTGNIDNAIAQAATMLSKNNKTAVDQISELVNLNLGNERVLRAVTKTTGYDGFLGNTPDIRIPFHPENIRSVNAAFDPANRGSANLVAGVMGGAVGLSALRQLMPQQEQE
jgi:hypothetical protein